MNIVRKLLVWLASATLTLLLLLTVASTIVAVVITPERIKDWLQSSHVYDNLVESVLHSTSQLETDEREGEPNFLREPGVQNAAKTAFSPELVQKSAENFIDGTFIWLNGDADKPTFSIDLTEAKKTFANEIGKYAKDRYNSLPVCKSGQLPDPDDDILTAKCRIRGYNIDGDVKKLVKEISTSKEFLGDPVVTANSFGKKDGGQDVFENLKPLAIIYQFSRLAPLLWGILALGAALIITFMSAERHRGLSRVGLSLIIAAILVLLTVFIASQGLDRAESAINSTSDPKTKLTQQTALSVAKEAHNDIKNIGLVFGIAYLLAGGGLIIASRKIRSGPTGFVKQTKGEQKGEELVAKKDTSPKDKTPSTS